MQLIRFVQVSGNPRTALNNLQRIVPPAIFSLVVQGFAAMAEAQVRTIQVHLKRSNIKSLLLLMHCCIKFVLSLVHNIMMLAPSVVSQASG